LELGSAARAAARTAAPRRLARWRHGGARGSALSIYLKKGSDDRLWWWYDNSGRVRNDSSTSRYDTEGASTRPNNNSLTVNASIYNQGDQDDPHRERVKCDSDPCDGGSGGRVGGYGRRRCAHGTFAALPYPRVALARVTAPSKLGARR